MAARTRRNGGNGLEAWPGYVDALSTLLMVIIFVLLVFVLAQAFLTIALNGRSKELDKATAELSALTNAMSLEKAKASSLELSVSQLSQQLAARTADRDRLNQALSNAKLTIQLVTTSNTKLQEQLKDATTKADTAAAALQTAQQQLADTTKRADTTAATLQTTQQQLTDTTNRANASAADLQAAQQQLADMKQQIAALDRTVSVDKDTLQEKLSDLAKLTEETRALAALRDSLEKQAQDNAARTMTEAQRRAAVEAQLSDEKKLGDSAKAQIALLNQQIDELKAQLASIASALDLAQSQNQAKDVEIANLGQKLNTALVQKVEELRQYRSEFFGKLRALLANRPGIQIVGDRFVFQSEVLFPVGSADLTPSGVAEMTALAITIKDIAAEIPPDLHWILRVDGHTDPQPVKGGAFTSNWELSAARAITVVKLLIADGVPPDHLAATGFGEYQPFGPGDTPEAYAKDRRIELRLTDR
ncbi:MAG TPA: peptidoglycan -binding protein [Rhodopila sp.]|uniref:peptidoglycan -binding protein n=1 Tax=Rhodopila sp. TaxID=2480087 RepID=UPI002CEAE6D6|nr:peptidoglycan -binding protein [Rhodopila sp.]HVY15574.1 peptidoglycan -binding protein [Rhodopila sp.]